MVSIFDYFRYIVRRVFQTVIYTWAREFNRWLLHEFLNERNSCYGNVLYHSQVHWPSNWIALIGFLKLLSWHTTGMLNNVKTNLQTENQRIIKTFSIVISFKRKIKIYATGTVLKIKDLCWHYCWNLIQLTFICTLVCKSWQHKMFVYCFAASTTLWCIICIM